MSITKDAVKTLKNSFVGCLVIIHLKDIVIPIIGPNEEDFDVNAMIDGFVVDIDQDFVYLGLEDGSILRAVPHASIGPIDIAMDNQPSLIDSFPSDDQEIH